jgi:hypothetical protein
MIMPKIISFIELDPFLDCKRSELLDALVLFRSTDRHWTEYEGGWHIAEIVEHLCIVEGMVVDEVKALLSRAPLLPSEPAENKLVDVMGLFAAKGLLGTKKHAPSYALPTQQVSYENGMARLAKIRVELKSFLPQLAARETNPLISPHPLGVDLNVGQWVHFAAVHEWAHINQVKRIYKANRVEE